MKFNKLKVIKIAAMGASVIGMIASAWVSDKENKLNLEKLVEQHLGNK